MSTQVQQPTEVFLGYEPRVRRSRHKVHPWDKRGARRFFIRQHRGYPPTGRHLFIRAVSQQSAAWLARRAGYKGVVFSGQWAFSSRPGVVLAVQGILENPWNR